jgi:DnaJ family protein C protein 2
VQPAGHAFFDQYERKAGSDDDAKDEASQDRSGSDEEQSSSRPSPKKKKEKKEREEALKLPECLKGEDLYTLLEVDAGASQEDLKKAFRQQCLTQHPDKHSDKTGAELEAVNLQFVKLQEAFNVLSDVKKRRKYDSMGEFDDSVPTKLKDGQDFFEVFDPVFKRNAKWSEKKPVPELGKLDTPYEKAKAFYDFWFDFQSWRDLDELIMEECGEDCFQDLEEADCREEKRWMMRENERLRGKFQKAERQRIFGFVELAEKVDPRMRAERDRQHAAKEAAKAAKEAKRLEAERQAQEEAERKAAEEEQARVARAEEKAKREEEKQVKKAARAKLRKVVKDLNLGLAEDSLQDFLLALDTEECNKLCKELEIGKGEASTAVLNVLKEKGIEPIFVKATEEEKSTEEGSPLKRKIQRR